YRVGLPDHDGFFKLDESMKTTMPNLLGNEGIYCVTVPDDTMSPRYHSGEVVFVNPHRPVARGYALVRQTDGRVAIREIVLISPDKITIRSFDKDASVEIPRDKVASLERIVASAETDRADTSYSRSMASAGRPGAALCRPGLKDSPMMGPKDIKAA